MKSLRSINIINSSPSINGNTLNRANCPTTNGISEVGGSANPYALTLNNFNFQGNWYFDNVNGQITDLNHDDGSHDVTINGFTGDILDSTLGNYSVY
jgi:hypothetical protein